MPKQEDKRGLDRERRAAVQSEDEAEGELQGSSQVALGGAAAEPWRGAWVQREAEPPGLGSVAQCHPDTGTFCVFPGELGWLGAFCAFT